METTPLTHAACVPIAFVGTVLGPLFLQDPAEDAAAVASSFQAIADLEPAQAAEDWPFIKAPVAREALEEMQKGLDEDHEGAPLKREYARLFAQAGRPALPGMRSEAPAGMPAAQRAQLAAWLRDHGVALSDEAAEGALGTVGLQLQLMALIAQRKPALLEEYLCAHLLKWAPRYLEELEAAAEHPFYHGLALLTLESLQGMQHMFGLKAK